MTPEQLAAIDEALEGAVAIAWDGEFRHYIVLDSTSVRGLIDGGYSRGEAHLLMIDGTVPEFSIAREQAREKLLNWYDRSAEGRRFISTLSYGPLAGITATFQYTSVIPREDLP